MKRTFAIAFALVCAGLWLTLAHRGGRQVPEGAPSGVDAAAVARAHAGAPELVPVAVPPAGPPARADGEWQGMRIDPEDERAVCDVSSRCGLAAACIGGQCGACAADADCASGEACVLDHCVRAELVECRGRGDCEDGAPCVLSGISPGARGNADMRAYCQGEAVGIAQGRAAHEENLRARAGIAAPPSAVTPRGLLETL